VSAAAAPLGHRGPPAKLKARPPHTAASSAVTFTWTKKRGVRDFDRQSRPLGAGPDAGANEAG